MALAPGAIFAGYTIQQTLTADEMGETYLAQHPRFPRCDVLNVLAGAVPADNGSRRRFLALAERAAGLNHRHIVRIYDCGEYDGRLWVATEDVGGPTAAQLIRDRSPTGVP